MANGVNANLARRWVVDAERRGGGALVKAASGTVASTFVPLQLPTVQTPPLDIRIELRRGATTINVSWPCAAASECALWIRALLR
jgi:transposase